MIATTGFCNEWRELNTRAENSGMTMPIHIGVGFAGSTLMHHYLPDDMSPWLRNGISFITPVLIGTIKEATDQNFDSSDIHGYAIGAGLSVTILNITF